MKKTVVELDLKGYSDIARELEEHLSAEVVMHFNEQIQGFVEAGLRSVGATPDQAVMATTGDGAILAFDEPEKGHCFAEAVHRECQVHNHDKTVTSARRWFRIGIATGELVVEVSGAAKKMAGSVIARAVRFEAAANIGEILVDVDTFNGLPRNLQARYGSQELVSGKRDERFPGRRCVVIPGLNAGVAAAPTPAAALSKPPAGPKSPPPPPVQPNSHLFRYAPDKLVGRDEELAALDAAWARPETHILGVVAWGGVGKTSLAAHWMTSRDVWNSPEFERVFDWSFYSQGTREQGGASADTFINAALEFFGDADLARSAASPWDKGARLAQLVGQMRSLLVLDGLEPLQHPPGPMAGQLKDAALATLLRDLAKRNKGLCIITTREGIADLDAWTGKSVQYLGQRERPGDKYPQLCRLSIEAGVELLDNLGVKGSKEEFQQLVEDVAGHALTLNLLGSYLVRAHVGDIRRRDRVRLENADKNVQGGHAFKAMAAYETWLAGNGQDGVRQLAVLRLLGLFDRPADAGCLAALRSKPAIDGLTEPLVGLDEDDWNLTVSSLAECRLVSVLREGAAIGDPPRAIDAHPLIREYFGRQLREKQPKARRSAHRRLYKHLKASTKNQPQPTLEDLQPLYQAVAHGCQAGLQQEACDEVYERRIQRGNEVYSTKKLGAIGADLGAIACFFEQPWTRVAANLTEPDRAWLLNEAAFRLQALGRLTEALEPMRAGLKMAVKQKDWKNVAACAGNLSELELTVGDVPGAIREAEQSVVFADRSGDAFQRMGKRATLADALHQAGRRDKALDRFREAEVMQAERQPQYPLLYSLQGFQYCDLLLAEAERDAWRVVLHLGAKTRNPGSQQQCGEVEQRAAQTLPWVEKQRWLLDIALDHLTLGRATFYRYVLSGGERTIRRAPDSRSGSASARSCEQVTAELNQARQHIAAAVDGLRASGYQHHVPRGLLSHAWLRFVDGDAEGARADLDDAWEIAERGSMRLFMADIHLYRARLFGDKESLTKAAATRNSPTPSKPRKRGDAGWGRGHRTSISPAQSMTASASSISEARSGSAASSSSVGPISSYRKRTP